MSLRKLVKNTRCWKFVNTKPGKYVKFFILLLLGMINLGVDWYFYAKIQLIQPGLVYGPISDSIKWATLSFCIISVITFIIEVIQNADDLLIDRKLPFLSQSMTNFLVIFIEDIPLLVLNLVVTLCRDGEPTVISVVKASLGIAVVVIRLILMLVVFWLLTEGKKSRFTLFTDIFSTFGLLIIAGISISIQLLNNFPTNSNGLIQTADPASFNQMNYVREKYLNSVGVYARWPLDADLPNTMDNYLWLADINEIIDNSYVSIQIRSSLNLSSPTSNYTLCIAKKSQQCFQIVNQNWANQLSLSEVDVTRLNGVGYDIGFSKEPAQDYKYLVGFIDYNINRLMANQSSCQLTKISSLIYAKFPASSVSTNSTYLKGQGNTGSYSFYSFNTDLLTVDRIWRTGIIGCAMSGDLSPKLNLEIRLSC